MAAAAAYPQAGTRFHVVTVDHGLRLRSAEEALFVGGLARGLGLGHSIRCWEGDKPAGNLQGRARDVRYRLLTEAARDLGADAVMTAHHQDDQIETHFLAAARKAGDRGLAAMRPARALAPGLMLLRPFLDVPGALLKAAAAPLQPVDDPSNHDRRYDRIRLRGALAAGEFDRAAILNRIEHHREGRDRQDAQLGHVIDGLLADGRLDVDPCGTVTLDAAAFAELDGVLGLELLARILPSVSGMAYPPERQATARLQACLLMARTGTEHQVQTLGGVVVEAGRHIVFRREFGRSGPASLDVSLARRQAVFDGRFDVEWSPLGGAARLVALGNLGRGNATQRCLPVLVDTAGTLLAVPEVLRDKLDVSLPILGLFQRVSWRLSADLPKTCAMDDPRNCRLRDPLR